MKDSQRYVNIMAQLYKYIKANNERFSTGSRTYAQSI